MTLKWIPDEQIGERQATGIFTRAASYGASMINACFFDQLIREEPEKYRAEIEKIISIQEQLISSLKALNLIGFFTPSEWLNTRHEGRLLIALLYLRQNPDEIVEDVIDRLRQLQGVVSQDYLRPLLDDIIRRSESASPVKS